MLFFQKQILLCMFKMYNPRLWNALASGVLNGDLKGGLANERDKRHKE